MLSQKIFSMLAFSGTPSLASVQSGKDFADIVEISIVSHMSNADDFACKNIKRTGKHNIVIVFDTIEDGSCGGSFRYFEYCDRIGESTLKVEVQSCTCDRPAGSLGNLFMSYKDIRISGNVVDRSAKSIDVADRHGIWKPFFFIIMCKSSQVCVEGCNRCLTLCHGFLCIVTDDYKSQSWRCRDNFLGAAAHNVNLPVRDTHWFTERGRYGIDNCHDAVFLEEWTDCGNIIQHTAWSITMDNGCVFVIVMFFEKFLEFLYIESFTVVSGIEFRDTTVHGNEICESFAVDTVIQYKDTVTRFGHRSAGGLQSENSLSTEDQGFVLGVEKTADLFAGFFIKFYEAFV